MGKKRKGLRFWYSVVATTIVSHSLYCSCETTMHMLYMSCTQCKLRLKSLRQEYVRQVKCGWTSLLPM